MTTKRKPSQAWLDCGAKARIKSHIRTLQNDIKELNRLYSGEPRMPAQTVALYGTLKQLASLMESHDLTLKEKKHGTTTEN